MKRMPAFAPLLMAVMFILSGCHSIGDKSSNISMIYGITTILSLLLLIGCCYLIKHKDHWFLLLFASVLVVNIGYFALSISQNLEEALLANRIAYLGSVLLPLAMMMSILDLTELRYKKSISAVLLVIALFMFCVAASPGYLTIYYENVSFEIINGVSVLHKVYGSWHILYLFYLLGYFISMVSVIGYAAYTKQIASTFRAVILVLAVLCNIGIWLIEQMVDINFEMLSVSYILSEMFLLFLHLLIQENEKLKEIVNKQQAAAPAENIPDTGSAHQDNVKLETLLNGIAELTNTERIIFDYYIEGKSTQEILEELNIKENTLKFHNKNIYYKLGVNSRKELKSLYKQYKAK